MGKYEKHYHNSHISKFCSGIVQFPVIVNDLLLGVQ